MISSAISPRVEVARLPVPEALADVDQGVLLAGALVEIMMTMMMMKVPLARVISLSFCLSVCLLLLQGQYRDSLAPILLHLFFLHVPRCPDCDMLKQ
jgi:hypothetical protein